MFFYYIGAEISLGYSYLDYGGSQLYTFNGGETIQRKAVCIATEGLAQLEFSHEDSITSKRIDRIVKSWK